MTTRDTEYAAVIAQIRQWPEARRLALLHEILDMVAGEQGMQGTGGPSRRTLPRAAGLLKRTGSPPSDEEIRRLLDERRSERFG